MKFLFENFFRNQGFNKIKSAISTVPLIKSEVVNASYRPLERFGHLYWSKIEIEVYTILLRIAHSLINSSRDGEPSYLLSNLN
jgi:hypothetical protein